MVPDPPQPQAENSEEQAFEDLAYQIQRANRDPPPRPPDDPETAVHATVEERPVRELTQTDRLNHRLLQSFLDRINNDPAHNLPTAVPTSSIDEEEI